MKRMNQTVYFMFCILSITACKDQKEESKVNDAIKVEVVDVRQTATNGNLHYSGTIEAYKTIPLSFQTTGTVQQVLVDAGDKVRKGQLVATVDNSDARSMYEISLSKYKQAKDAYNRLKEVHEQGSLTDIKWVEMETNLSQAESSLALAKSNLNKCRLLAPEDGVIGSRNIEPGALVPGGLKSPLELVKIGQVYVRISVPENEISQIKKQTRATFRVSALNDRNYEGKIRTIGVVASDVSRTYEIKVLVSNADLSLKPGMVCDVDLHIASTVEKVVVPYQTVCKDDDGKSYVYVVDVHNHQAIRRIVQTGDYTQDQIVILSGLNAGEKIVSGGKEKIADHTKIVY